MKISILSYSFRGLYNAGMMDVFGYLETCKFRYGLNAADLWSGFFPTTEDEFVLKVGEGLQERDMELADIAVDGANVWEPDPGQREQHHQRALRFLEIADALNARFVRIDAGGSRETMVWTDEEFDFIAARYREYAQYAYDHGFKVGLENHWGPEKVWSNLKRMYEAVNHPGFGVSCHLWSWAGSEEEQAIADAAVAPWVSHTHIAWYLCEGPLLDKLGNLWRVGYNGYYSVEHHSATDEYEEIGIQIAKVRDALNKLRLGKAEG
jgi:sugar phosphate isomerase/epimerase